MPGCFVLSTHDFVSSYSSSSGSKFAKNSLSSKDSSSPGKVEEFRLIPFLRNPQ
jgi:hypothetical protein